MTVNSGALVAGQTVGAAAGVSNAFRGTNYSLGTLLINGGRFSSSVTDAQFATSTIGGASLQFILQSGYVDINGVGVGTFTMGNMGASSAASNFLMNGGTLELTLASAASFDQIIGASVSNAFTITGGVIDFGNSIADYAATYQIFSGFSSGNVSGLSFTNYDTANYTASLSNTGVLSFAAIPEPSTCVLLGIGAVLMLGVRFRQRTLNLK